MIYRDEIHKTVGCMSYSSDTFIYCYDDASLVSINLYKIIYEKMISNKDKNILIINKKEILEENYKEICDYLGFHIDEIFAIYKQGEEEIKTADYTVDDGIKMKEFLISYFR